MSILLQIPSWLTGFNFLLAAFGFLVLIGAVVISLLVKGRDQVSSIQLDRATASEALIKLRDMEVATLQREKEQLEKDKQSLDDELEAVTAEHRTLVSLNIAKLMEFWGEKDAIEAQHKDLERQIRILTLRKDGDKN